MVSVHNASTHAPDNVALSALCRTTLEGNRREGARQGLSYRFTLPSPGRYPWQFYWDSCFSAISWRRFDRHRARAELETLLRAARPDGFIGHAIFWTKPVSRVRSLFYDIRSRCDFMTATIQPPLLAWAWRIAVGDPAEVPAIVRHHESVERERAIDGDGLLWLIQPDESGLDASPKFDSACGWHRDGLPGFPPTWINAAWLLWLGLVRLGYHEAADELAARVGGAVAAAGLREYYDPYTGTGIGASEFSWSSLVMELVDPDPLAASSHLESCRDETDDRQRRAR